MYWIYSSFLMYRWFRRWPYTHTHTHSLNFKEVLLTIKYKMNNARFNNGHRCHIIYLPISTMRDKNNRKNKGKTRVETGVEPTWWDHLIAILRHTLPEKHRTFNLNLSEIRAIIESWKFMVLCLKHWNVIRKEIITKRKGIIFVGVAYVAKW